MEVETKAMLQAYRTLAAIMLNEVWCCVEHLKEKGISKEEHMTFMEAQELKLKEALKDIDDQAFEIALERIMKDA